VPAGEPELANAKQIVVRMFQQSLHRPVSRVGQPLRVALCCFKARILSMAFQPPGMLSKLLIRFAFRPS